MLVLVKNRSDDRGRSIGVHPRRLIDNSRFSSLSNEPSIDNAEIDRQQEHYEDVVEETEETKDCLGDDVERRDKIEQRDEEAEEDAKAKHPD